LKQIEVADLTKRQVTAGFAILGQKQYTSALVRYLASVRAEVFQSSFVHFLYICFSIGQRFRAEDFQIPQHRKALSLCIMQFDILILSKFRQHNLENIT
jgi:hypothetical protein